MMRGLIAGVALVAMLGGVAAASPLKIRNGSTVRVALQGKREPGVGLRMHSGGWQLELAAPAGAVADVFDVTDGAAGKWTVQVEDGVVFFDQETFIAGHAYRVLVRRGAESLGATLVYLYAPSMATRQHKVTFDDAEASGNSSDGPALVKKPTL